MKPKLKCKFNNYFKRRLHSGIQQSYQVLSRTIITISKHYQNHNYCYYYNYGGQQESEEWNKDHIG